MIRAAWVIFIACMVPLGFWIGGFNFDNRGHEAISCFSITLAVLCFAAQRIMVWKVIDAH